MDGFIAWLVFRAFVIFIGFLCLLLGYRLLVKGVFDGGADITAAWDNNKKLLLRRASPGVIFAFVGGVIIVSHTVYSQFKQNAIYNNNPSLQQPGVDSADARANQTKYTMLNNFVEQCSSLTDYKGFIARFNSLGPRGQLMNLKGLVDDCADISDKSTQQSKQQLVSITTEAHAEYWPSKNSNQSTGKHDNNSNGFIKKRESVHKNINEPKY